MHLIRRKIFLTCEQFYYLKRRGSDPWLFVWYVTTAGSWWVWSSRLLQSEQHLWPKTGRPFVSLSLCGALGWKLFIWSILFSPLLWPDLCGLLGDKSALALCCSILMESRGRRERYWSDIAACVSMEVSEVRRQESQRGKQRRHQNERCDVT